MNRSVARATEAERDEIVALHQQAINTPVIALSGAHAMKGGLSADARRAMVRRIDEIATAHGLKPQAGEWGFDPETRQFLSEHPIVEGQADG